MFNQKEKEIIDWGLKNGKSKDEVIKAITNYRVGSTGSETELQSSGNKEQSFTQDAMGDIGQAGTEIKGAWKEMANKTDEAIGASAEGKQGLIRTALQAFGAGAGAFSSNLASIVKGGVKAILPQKAEDAVKEGIGAVAKPIMQTQAIKTLLDNYNALDGKTKRDVDSLLGISSLALDLVGINEGYQGIKTGVNVVKDTAKKTIKLGSEIIEKAPEIIEKSSKIIKPQPTPIQAVGQITQGATQDIKPAVNALAQLDTSGVKTFKDLNSKISSKITELAKQVDIDLAKDTNKKLLNNLTLTAKSEAGTIVKSTPVKDALNQLEELYTKIGDKVSGTNIKELRVKAKTEGLTNLEINNLAKRYGQEFSQKAFSKLGDPLTSVNAQMYENTRSSLKDLARQGITGKEAQIADKAMSNLYNTQSLIKRNVEAVNKLKNKISERGLLEKAGYYVAKYADLVTGGTIRGFVGGILPRGAGYKIMNAIDIEKSLERNLKIIQEAIKSGNDERIIKLVKQLENSLPTEGKLPPK